MRIARPPFTPPRGAFFGLIAVLSLINLLGTLTLHMAHGQPRVLSDVALSAVACGVTFGIAVVTFALLPRLGVVHPHARPPYWRAWLGYVVVFYGGVTAALAAGGLVLESARGWPSDLTSDLFAFVLPYPGLVALLMIFERAAAAAHAAREEQAALQGEIERLFASRDALIVASAGRGQEVIRALAQRAAPRMASAERALAALAAEGGGDGGAIAEELGRLSEEEFRRLSHLLHPSIVQVGLVPALHSLLAAHARGSLARLDAGPEDEERVDRGVSDAGVLAAYRAVEVVLDRVAGPESRVAVGVTRGTGLELAIAIESPQPLDVRAELTGALVDSRVELAGGRWSLEDGPGRASLRITLPVTA